MHFTSTSPNEIQVRPFIWFKELAHSEEPRQVMKAVARFACETDGEPQRVQPEDSLVSYTIYIKTNTWSSLREVTPTLAGVISQGERGVLSSDCKALTSLVFSEEINEQRIEIHYITHNRRRGNMYRPISWFCATLLHKTGMRNGQNEEIFRGSCRFDPWTCHLHRDVQTGVFSPLVHLLGIS